jgi:hypothetical protein
MPMSVEASPIIPLNEIEESLKNSGTTPPSEPETTNAPEKSPSTNDQVVQDFTLKSVERFNTENGPSNIEYTDKDLKVFEEYAKYRTAKELNDKFHQAGKDLAKKQEDLVNAQDEENKDSIKSNIKKKEAERKGLLNARNKELVDLGLLSDDKTSVRNALDKLDEKFQKAQEDYQTTHKKYEDVLNVQVSSELTDSKEQLEASVQMLETLSDYYENIFPNIEPGSDLAKLQGLSDEIKIMEGLSNDNQATLKNTIAGKKGARTKLVNRLVDSNIYPKAIAQLDSLDPNLPADHDLLEAIRDMAKLNGDEETFGKANDLLELKTQEAAPGTPPEAAAPETTESSPTATSTETDLDTILSRSLEDIAAYIGTTEFANLNLEQRKEINTAMAEKCIAVLETPEEDMSAKAKELLTKAVSQHHLENNSKISAETKAHQLECVKEYAKLVFQSPLGVEKIGKEGGTLAYFIALGFLHALSQELDIKELETIATTLARNDGDTNTLNERQAYMHNLYLLAKKRKENLKAQKSELGGGDKVKAPDNLDKADDVMRRAGLAQTS